jgi:hypothetical protein
LPLTSDSFLAHWGPTTGFREWPEWGHDDRFPSPRPSDRCRFSQETFARRFGNGRGAPKADLRSARFSRSDRYLDGHGCILTSLDDVGGRLFGTK